MALINKEVDCYLLIALLVVVGWYLLKGVESFYGVAPINSNRIPYNLKMDDNRKPERGRLCACDNGPTHRKIDIDRVGSNNALNCTCAKCDYYNEGHEQDFLDMVDHLRRNHNPTRDCQTTVGVNARPKCSRCVSDHLKLTEPEAAHSQDQNFYDF